MVLLVFCRLLCQRQDGVGGEFSRVNVFEFWLDELVAVFATARSSSDQAVQQGVLRLQGVAALVGREIYRRIVADIGVGFEQGKAFVYLSIA